MTVRGLAFRNIGGIDVQVCDADAAAARFETARNAHQPLKVVFLNVHLADCAARTAEVKDALASCFVLNDGLGIDIASRRLFGRAFPVNMNGTDFVPAMLDRMRPGLRLYLLGGTPAVIETAASYYLRREPDHPVIGCHHGYFAADEAALVASAVQAARPDLILVGMGCPRQELRLDVYIPDTCPIGVGALFDFQAGRVARAPAVLRRLRLEWLFRLVLVPRRLFGRYFFANFVFLGRTLMPRVRRKRC